LPERELVHPDVDAVLAIHGEVLAAHGGSPGVRDRALLESAVAAPQASFGGKPLIEDPVEVAAAYLFYLCRNHPFVDGNKRTALATCLVFLGANDLLTDPDLPGREVNKWEAFVLAVANSQLDRDGTAKALKTLLRKKRKPAGRP